jgi:hypothetical protein
MFRYHLTLRYQFLQQTQSGLRVEGRDTVTDLSPCSAVYDTGYAILGDFVLAVPIYEALTVFLDPDDYLIFYRVGLVLVWTPVDDL